MQGESTLFFIIFKRLGVVCLLSSIETVNVPHQNQLAYQLKCTHDQYQLHPSHYCDHSIKDCTKE